MKGMYGFKKIIILIAALLLNVRLVYALPALALTNTSGTVELTSTGLNPANASTDVSLTNSLYMYFTHPVSAGTGYITIYNADNTVFQHISVSSDDIVITGNIVEIKHNAFLPGTSYYVFVGPNAICDYSDNGMYFEGLNKIYDWSFKTVNARALPVKSFSPTGESIAVNAPFIVEFTEEVKVGAGSVGIYDSSNVLVSTIDAKDIVMSDGNRQATIPHEPLDYGKSYYILIDNGVFAGRRQNATYSGITGHRVWFFTTESLGYKLNGTNYDTANIGVTSANQTFTIDITGGGTAGTIIIPADFYTHFSQFPNFTLKIGDSFTQINLDKNFGVATGIDALLNVNKMKLKEAGYKITVPSFNGTQTAKQSVSSIYSGAELIASVSSIAVDIINLSSEAVLKTVEAFETSVTYTVAVNPAELSDCYTVFAYDAKTGTFAFVPHKKTQTGLNILSKSNGTYLIINNELTFSDIQNHWAEQYIKTAASKGIILGMGDQTYKPDDHVTRAQFIKMLADAMNLPEADAAAKSFSDVNKGDWYYDSVMRMSSAGLLIKFSGTSFLPDNPITREEMAGILAVAIQRENIPAELEYILLDSMFTDFNQISPPYLGDIGLMVKLKIMTGITSSHFAPVMTATRAQAVTVIVRALRAMGMID